MEENNTPSLTLSKTKEDDNALECNKLEENSQSNNDDLERKHFHRVLNAFKNYKRWALGQLQGALEGVARLPPRHRALLGGHRAHLEALQGAVGHNQHVLDALVRDAQHLFHEAPPGTVGPPSEEREEGEAEKVEGVLRQLFREWSLEGEAERDASFAPILQEIQRRFPQVEGRAGVRVLVPGAGLGRLPYEIARLGYSCQGNEFSLFMLFTSNFVLNKCRAVGGHHVFPWVLPLHNRSRPCHALLPAPFPDVDPSALPPGPAFSMAAGSFLEIYNDQPGAWECVATCFFVDTASNVAEYVDVVWHVLAPGGTWVNLGPLLYHGAKALALSWEELREIIAHKGFTFLREEVGVCTPYAQDPRSMMVHAYRSVFFSCTKPAPKAE
ncbi:hypothetical protein JTE90_006133 [Oedothorax gibbosus]|uniref:carnosine N-methyltransferase n=1 Tax=Oedothorax gibbosus TaxID=931172 RepID=A0AAV6V513_9ARAC|nr:hypothetical protein JTE90_006133 [Oedothorax gibbosus]